MSDTATKTTRLEIFGAEYTVRGDHDSEHLEELASKVDGDMRQIAAQLPRADTARLAILTALNIADELFQCRQRKDGDRTEINQRLATLSDQLGDALEA